MNYTAKDLKGRNTVGSPKVIASSTNSAQEHTEQRTRIEAGLGQRQSSFRTTIAFLKDIKELLAITLLFITGAIWIYTAFATKQYVAGVRCLLASTIERIDNEAQSRQLKSEIIDTGVSLNRLRSKDSLSANEILESEKIKTHRVELETRKNLADKAVQSSNNRSIRGDCE